MNTSKTSSTGAIAQRGKVAFVQACWHRDIVDQLRDSFQQEFLELSDKKIDFHEVPGAYEIPLFANALAITGEYAAVVAAGLVVDGGIYRHDFVATAVIDGLMRVQLDSGMPVFSAVLTPHHFHESGEHAHFFKQHFVIKGQEVAQACAQTLTCLSRIA
ncbi:MAG: 6,7-dimethyl-8-ribityllumazine synthase [Cryomorphaceae bacterium]|jgi:6,7-dimethyl-8-ribityllumazine synthase